MRCINSVVIAAFVMTGARHVSAQQPALGGTVGVNAPAAAARETTPKLPPGARTEVLSTTIKGNAVDSMDRQLGNTLVRLRDARVGRIVETQLTDKAGVFSFNGLDPGSYIVEVMASDQTVLTASQLINVNAGEAVSALVKLPFRIPPFAGALGNNPASVAAVLTTAVASGALATTLSGQPVTPDK
jgi:hypothetical protein